MDWKLGSVKRDESGRLLSGYLELKGMNYMKYLMQTSSGVIYNHAWDSRTMSIKCEPFFADLYDAMYSLEELFKKYDNRTLAFYMKQSKGGAMYVTIGRNVKKVRIPPKAELKTDSMSFYFKIDQEDTLWRARLFVTFNGNIFLK